MQYYLETMRTTAIFSSIEDASQDLAYAHESYALSH